MTASGRRASARSHLLILIGFAALFVWIFGRFFLSDRYLADSDLYQYYLPLFLSPIKTWSSFEFGGLPAFADPGQLTFYLPNILFGMLLRSWTALAASAYLLAACFTYTYVYRLTGSKGAAAFSALAYSLSEAMLERMAHFGSVHVIAWLPLIALAVDGIRASERRALWLVVGAVAVASGILAGHPQPALYMLDAAVLYALVGLIVERSSWRGYALTAALFTLGVALSAVKSFPFAEATTLIARQEIGFDRFVGRTLAAPQTLSFLFPTVIHGDSRELPTYVGAATLLLALVSIVRLRRNWRTAFWGGYGILAVLLALGTATPLVDAVYHLPFNDRMRNVSRHLFLFAFAASVLAGFAIAAIQRGEIARRALIRATAGFFGLMAAGALLIALRPGSFEIEVPLGGPGPGPLSVLSVGIWIQLAIAAAAGVLVLFLPASPRASLVLIALLVGDLLSALPHEVGLDGVEFTSVRAADLLPSVHAEGLGRQLDATGGRALAIGGTQIDEVVPAGFARVWRIPIAGGYGPMLLNRYSELASMGTSGEVRTSALEEGDVALDLLSVRFAIVNRDRLDHPAVRGALASRRWRQASTFKTSRTTDRGADADTGNETEVTIFENLRALPRAWFVESLLPLSDAEALRVIHGGPLPDGTRFDPRATAFVDPADVTARPSASPGVSSARITDLEDGRIALAASTTGGGFMVINENYYPGWRARIDGKDVPVHRTDVSFQGVVVPPGEHRIEFSLESATQRAGYAVSSAALVTCLVLLGLAVRQRISYGRKRPGLSPASAGLKVRPRRA